MPCKVRINLLLSCELLTNVEMGTRVSAPVQAVLKKMLKAQAAIPALAHYVDYLNAWRAGDYSGAFDNLHRYFDYTMQNRDK